MPVSHSISGAQTRTWLILGCEPVCSSLNSVPITLVANSKLKQCLFLTRQPGIFRLISSSSMGREAILIPGATGCRFWFWVDLATTLPLESIAVAGERLALVVSKIPRIIPVELQSWRKPGLQRQAMLIPGADQMDQFVAFQKSTPKPVHICVVCVNGRRRKWAL
eukprot:1153263-Pelagomonas_calceolata.AAC.8